jgi:hypothetical protein
MSDEEELPIKYTLEDIPKHISMGGKAHGFIEGEVKWCKSRTSANINVPKKFAGKKVLMIFIPSSDDKKDDKKGDCIRCRIGDDDEA